MNSGALARDPGEKRAPSGWVWSRIRDVVQETRERAGTNRSLPVLSVTKHQGIVRAESYFKKEVHGRDTSNYKVVRKGDLAYATIHLDEGSVGHLTGESAGIVSPMYTVMRVDGLVDGSYLFAVLKRPESLAVYNRLSEGTVNRRASIGFDSLGAIHLLLPPLPEQRKIAAILSSVDEAIEGTQAVIDQLQVLKKAMMAELLESEHQPVDLGEVIDYKKGFPFQSSSFVEHGRLVVRLSDCKGASISKEGCPSVTEELAQTLPAHELRTGDVILATVGSRPTAPASVVGRVFRVPPAMDGALLNQNTVRLRASSQIDQSYLFHRLGGADFSAHLFKSIRGNANQASITLETAFSFRFGLPSLLLQQKIARMLDSIDEAVDTNSRSLVGLTEVKSALMSVLLTGEVRVKT